MPLNCKISKCQVDTRLRLLKPRWTLIEFRITVSHNLALQLDSFWVENKVINPPVSQTCLEMVWMEARLLYHIEECKFDVLIRDLAIGLQSKIYSGFRCWKNMGNKLLFSGFLAWSRKLFLHNFWLVFTHCAVESLERNIHLALWIKRDLTHRQNAIILHGLAI